MSKSSVDGYGFQKPGDSEQKRHDKFMSQYLGTLAKRASRWNRFLGEKETVSKSAKVKRFCRKGIPHEHRTMVWLCVTGAETRMKNDPDLYRNLLRQPRDEEVIECINKDIPRTYPENIYFSDTRDPTALRKPLFNVLVALAVNNPKVSYCQGLNFIVGLLLIVTRDEEKTFWLMDTLINNILPDFYLPNMIDIKVEQQLLGELVREKVPDLHAHLQTLDVDWCLVGLKWFFCLFADVFPIETVFRIWDCLFYEGAKILLRGALTLLMMNKDKLLKCNNFTSFVDMLQEIPKDTSVLHCHTFLQGMFELPGSLPSSKISKLRVACRKNFIQTGF